MMHTTVACWSRLCRISQSRVGYLDILIPNSQLTILWSIHISDDSTRHVGLHATQWSGAPRCSSMETY